MLGLPKEDEEVPVYVASCVCVRTNQRTKKVKMGAEGPGMEGTVMNDCHVRGRESCGV